MCGADPAQKQLQTEQAAFYKEGIDHANQTYSQDQEILGKMTAAYEPILAAGPNQRGFDQAEETNLNTQATEGTARDFNSADRALREHQAAQGGTLPTGQQSQEEESLLSSAAGTESQEKQQILSADYAQGYDEWKQAAGGLGSTAGLLNPTGYSGEATNAGNAAGNTANEIAAENNSWVNAALGAAGAIGTGIVSENPGGIFGG